MIPTKSTFFKLTNFFAIISKIFSTYSNIISQFEEILLFYLLVKEPFDLWLI